MKTLARAALASEQLIPEVKAFIGRRQEWEYRRLARALRLGADPARAYERLARRPRPFDHPAPLWETSDGAERSVMAEAWQPFAERVADLHSDRVLRGTPTRYEDPERYPRLALIFDEVQEALAERGGPSAPPAVLATLPSGDVDARVMIEPATRTPVVFFEQGLFSFLHDFVLATGWAAPPLSPRQLSDDAALVRLPRRCAMPPEALLFVESLLAYVVDGTPTATRRAIPRPADNRFAVEALLGQMKRFVMAHELAHIAGGHVNGRRDERQEHDADASSLDFVTTRTLEDLGSWAIGFWACELVLIALNFLYRALGILAFGPRKLLWIDDTHPEPLRRRERLRAAWRDREAPPLGVAAARELSVMTDALFQRLWDMTLPAVVTSYEQGARPSPMWQEMIDSRLIPRV